MLPKRKRLSRSLYPEILKKGRVFHSPHFSLRLFKKTPCKNEPSRFSFVASTKAGKKATERNLLKRRGYHAMRKIYPSVRPCANGAFFFKKGAAGLKYKEIEEEVAELLKKAGVFKVETHRNP